jgi:pectate lyase
VRLGDAPFGFAALARGTVGGGAATPLLVTTPDAFKTHLADSQPRVLYVRNDLDFRTAQRTGVPTCADNAPERTRLQEDPSALSERVLSSGR